MNTPINLIEANAPLTAPVVDAMGDHAAAARVLEFIRSQVVNTQGNAAALRPFRSEEFGTDPASPSPAHIAAANALIKTLRQQLLARTEQLEQVALVLQHRPNTEQMPRFLAEKEAALSEIKLVEKVWEFYLELFNKRQTPFGEMLLATDRIALDCYQVVYTGLDNARSIPSPSPFSLMQTGFTPATFRRGIRFSKIGKRNNPFPIVALPFHRLANPWTLGAVHHEVAHNLQSDLGLWHVVPRRIQNRLVQAGIPLPIAQIWARWHKEIWADLAGLLLGGPAIVSSLLDVLGRSPRTTLSFNPVGVHPTPYLRAKINFELLRRMGFRKGAVQMNNVWDSLYPSPSRSNLPPTMLTTFPKASRLVVDTICYQPYSQLGNKALAEVIAFKPSYQPMIQEAGKRVAEGVDPGIIPARFLVSAARWALKQRLASPEQIRVNFYKALNKR